MGQPKHPYERPTCTHLMTTTTHCGRNIYYATDGDGPPVVFINEAGFGGWQWGWQHAALAGPFRTVVWDLPGTGRSDGFENDPSLTNLVDAFEAVCRAANARAAHVVGLGLGGAVALEAASTTNRVQSLALIGTAADAEAFTYDPILEALAGDRPLERSLERCLSDAFVESHPSVVDGILEWRRDGDADLGGWQDQVRALDGWTRAGELFEVTQPTRVIHGTADEIVSETAGRALADGLPRGSFVPLEEAGHLGSVERSRVVNDELYGLFESVSGPQGESR